MSTPLTNITLTRAIIDIIRPSDPLPTVLQNNEELQKSISDVVDQRYVLLVRIAWKLESKNDADEETPYPWLDLWTELHSHRVFGRTHAAADWDNKGLAERLNSWVFKNLARYGAVNSLDIEIVSRLLRKWNIKFDDAVIESCSIAAVNGQQSCHDFASLVVWALRQHNENGDVRLPLVVDEMLGKAQTEILCQLDELVKPPIQGVLPEMHSLLAKRIRELQDSRRGRSWVSRMFGRSPKSKNGPEKVKTPQTETGTTQASIPSVEADQ